MAVLAAAFGPAPAAGQDESSDDIHHLELEELLRLEVVSASRAAEPLGEAPATVIVIRRAEILARGYTELSELLDDLPGMQVIRPYGATYLKSYWRGFRNTIGDPFLLLVDGMVMNHLYFNTADVMVTVPLSNVERVEVVYGPASVAYGANAFMGVIYVVTADPPADDGSHLTGFLTGGSAAQRIADLGWTYRHGDIALKLAARLDNGDLDAVDNNAYEYTRDSYYQDRRLWGGFLDNPNLGGSFSSPHRHRAFDLRLALGDLELGVSSHRMENGYGMEYAADRAQSRGVWTRPDLSAYARFVRQLSSSLSSSTLLRYRESDVGNESFWVEGLEQEDQEGHLERLVQMSYWQALNSSWSLFEDLEATLSERLRLSFGLKLEEKSLQKAYDISYGPALPPAQVDATGYPYPLPPPATRRSENRITTEDVGVYALARLGLGASQGLHLGLRADDNSEYGSTVTVRTGYVARLGDWTVKALYGEAFQEPVPRLLYGGWTGAGSDPDLEPERSRTGELSAELRLGPVAQVASLYRADDDDTIVNTAGGARNLGERTVVGLDYHLQAILHPADMREMRLWAYASFLLDEEESVNGGGDTVPIGDLAHQQVIGGASMMLGDALSASLRGRYVSGRRTVATNPLGRLPSFATFDAAMSWQAVRGVTVALKVTNLFDERYAHPGVRQADAGVEPGFFDETGRWRGSVGFYNSLLPQSGRAYQIMLHVGR